MRDAKGDTWTVTIPGTPGITLINPLTTDVETFQTKYTLRDHVLLRNTLKDTAPGFVIIMLKLGLGSTVMRYAIALKLIAG